jgi:hypothetical protein
MAASEGELEEEEVATQSPPQSTPPSSPTGDMWAAYGPKVELKMVKDSNGART